MINIIINLLFVFVLVVVPAIIQANRFKNGKTINHTLWATTLCVY